MDYQELITIWNSSTAELESNVQINRKLIKEVAFRKIKSGLYSIKWASIFGLLAGFLWTIFIVRFIINNFGEFRFLFSAFLLLAISLFSIILYCYKLKQYYSFNPGSSVLETQQKIEMLKKLEIMDIKSLYIIIPLFSAPFAIVVAKAFAGIDLFAIGILSKGLLYYTMGTIVIAIILVFILQKYPGKSLQESIAFLNELKEDQKMQ